MPLGPIAVVVYTIEAPSSWISSPRALDVELLDIRVSTILSSHPEIQVTAESSAEVHPTPEVFVSLEGTALKASGNPSSVFLNAPCNTPIPY